MFKVTTGACALRSACPDPGALKYKVKRLCQNVCVLPGAVLCQQCILIAALISVYASWFPSRSIEMYDPEARSVTSAQGANPAKS